MGLDTKPSVANAPLSLRRRPGAPAVDRWLRRRQVAAWVLVIAAGVSLGVLWMQSPGEARALHWHHQQVKIEGVTEAMELQVQRIDGSGHRAAVGLMGVETTEGATTRARQWLLRTCGADALWLEVQTPPPAEGRAELMAYVYLPDGRMLNEEMLRLGLAEPAAQAKHPLRPWFRRLRARAPATGSGSLAKRR